MNGDLRIPDIEILIGAAGYDVASFSFYRRDDIHQGYDVVCAMPGRDAAAPIRKILQDAIKAINTADWHDVDVLREDVVSGEDEPPF